MNIKLMQERIAKLAADREWQKFHTPKNLVMALGGEAGELLELFQWLSENEAKNIMNDANKKEQTQDELADIFTYLIRLCDILDVDLEAAFWKKIEKTEKKYPIELAKGNAKKYTDLKS